MRKIVRYLALALVAVCGQFARAEVVVVVSAQSGVEKLSSQQVADIYMAKESYFPGGALALPMDMYPGSVLRKEFYRKVVHKSARQLRRYWSRRMMLGTGQPPREVGAGIDMKKLVADNPNTIGYIDRSAVDASVRVVSVP